MAHPSDGGSHRPPGILLENIQNGTMLAIFSCPHLVHRKHPCILAQLFLEIQLAPNAALSLPLLLSLSLSLLLSHFLCHSKAELQSRSYTNPNAPQPPDDTCPSFKVGLLKPLSVKARLKQLSKREGHKASGKLLTQEFSLFIFIFQFFSWNKGLQTWMLFTLLHILHISSRPCFRIWSYLATAVCSRSQELQLKLRRKVSHLIILSNIDLLFFFSCMASFVNQDAVISELTSEMTTKGFFWSYFSALRWLSESILVLRFLWIPKVIDIALVLLYVLLMDSCYIFVWQMELHLREVSTYTHSRNHFKFCSSNMELGYVVADQILSCRILCLLISSTKK